MQAWELSAETQISVETKKKSVEKFLPVRGKNVSGGKNKVTPFLAQRLPGYVVSRLQRWRGYTAW